MVGSVYQDMDLVGFIRKHISEIRGRILVVCSPCFVRAIRSILRRANIESIIIDYFVLVRQHWMVLIVIISFRYIKITG